MQLYSLLHVFNHRVVVRFHMARINLTGSGLLDCSDLVTSQGALGNIGNLWRQVLNFLCDLRGKRTSLLGAIGYLLKDLGGFGRMCYGDASVITCRCGEDSSCSKVQFPPIHTGNRSLIHEIQQDPHLSLSVAGAGHSNQS